LNAQADLSRLVREPRERTGLIQEKFAAKLGVTYPTINRWEDGKARPSPLAIQQLKDLFRDMGKDSVYLAEKYFGKVK